MYQGLFFAQYSSVTTVKLQWLKHIWNHENMFETGVVRANECEPQSQVKVHNRDIFSIFFNMKVPHLSDSNENTQYTIFNIKKENHPYYPESAAMEFFPRESKMSLK